MKRLIFIAIFISTTLFCAQLKITAEHFEADEVKQQVVFNNNVVVEKEKDVLKAKKVVVDFDSNKKPLKYVATGNVSVKIAIKDKNYFAKGDNLLYEPVKELYVLTGNAFLQEIDSDKRIYGQKIKVNQSDGTYSVDGEEGKPAIFIFQLEDEK